MLVIAEEAVEVEAEVAVEMGVEDPIEDCVITLKILNSVLVIVAEAVEVDPDPDLDHALDLIEKCASNLKMLN